MCPVVERFDCTCGDILYSVCVCEHGHSPPEVFSMQKAAGRFFLLGSGNSHMAMSCFRYILYCKSLVFRRSSVPAAIDDVEQAKNTHLNQS